MDDIITTEAKADEVSRARCRDLLGDEAAELSDEQLDVIRQHAHTMAIVLGEVFLSGESRS